MDATATCALVNTTAFTNYNQIVAASQTLVDFSMSSSYVSGKFTSVVTTNEFTRFITSSSNFAASAMKPVLVSGKQSIVKDYLGYPTGTYATDFYTYGTARPFRSLAAKVTEIITAGDLCASNDIYNPTVYSANTPIQNLSLTTLYQTLATSNLDASIVTSMRNRIDLLQNKNNMFYSFFVYEYCYYNTMYNTILSQYFSEYTSTSPSGRLPNMDLLKNSAGTVCSLAANSNDQAIRLDALSLLLARVNSRLTDMRNLLSAIQNYYSGSLQSMQTTLNTAALLGSDMHAQDKVVLLRDQSIKVKQAKDESTFREEILEYTSEKNRYSNILLGIYAFLNIAIIGVIFAIKE